MSTERSKFKQVLNFFESPAFLVSKSKTNFKVYDSNDKFKKISKSNSKDFKGEELEEFLINTFEFETEQANKFIEELNRFSKLEKLNSSNLFQLNIKNEVYQFCFEKLSLDDQVSFLITLDIQLEAEHKGKLDSEPLEIDFFKQIFESLPIGIAVNTIDESKTLYVNSSLTQIYGRDLEDLVDISTFFQKVYPDEKYRQEVSEMVLKDIKSGDPERMQWKNLRITTKTGQTKIINAKNIPLYDQNLMISTVIDITESFEAQEKLRIAKSRFDLASQASSDAVWEWDLSEDELYWGEGYERLFGYQINNNRVSKTFWESKIHPSDFEPFFESLEVAMNDKSLSKWTFDYRFLKKQGDYANVRENVIIIRSENGKPIRLVGALQDITKALKRENHLDLLEKLVDGTKDSILVTEVKSNNFLESEIVYANSSFQNLFGFNPSEIFGQTPQELYVTKKNKTKFSEIEDKLSDWDSVDADILCLTKNEIEFWNSLSITPIMDDQGWYTHWMIVNRDVNDLRTNAEKRELLAFSHQAFQTDEDLESILCKVSMKIEDLVRSNVCEFWLVDNYTKDLNKFLEFREGNLHEVSPKNKNQFYKEFVEDVYSTKFSKTQIKKSKSTTIEENGIELSYGFEIRSHTETIGVLVLGFKDAYSREETLNAIFTEFSIQLANEITRKRTENELSTFFEYTPDFMCIAGKNGFLKKINKRASDSLGYSLQTLLTTPLLEFVKKEDHKITFNLLHQAREFKGYHNQDIRLLTQDNQVLQVDWTVFSLENSEDVFCIGRNVTAYKENLTKLKTQNEKFRIISETVKEAVWDFDLNTEEIAWGKGLERLFGYDPDDFGIAEELWLDKLHPEDRKRVQDSFEISLKDPSKDEWREEYKFQKQDGTFTDVLDRGKIIRNEKGEALRMVGTMQDISEFKQYQTKLENLNKKLLDQTKSLTRSNQDLEEFAYIASHDLKEPLRMVTGFLTRLEQKYAGDLDEKAKEYINFAVDGAKRMRQIINGLLNFSKVGRQDLSLSQVDLSLIIDDVKVLLREAIEENNAKIETGDLPVIYSVEDELKEVFLNLIENSIKYSHQDSVPKIEIDYSENENQHVFSVKDNGIGISEEYFEKIFGIFQRLHSRIEYSGTGIGLAIVKKIINNLDGEISLESELGKGSKFLIKLPKKSINDEKPSNSQ